MRDAWTLDKGQPRPGRVAWYHLVRRACLLRHQSLPSRSGLGRLDLLSEKTKDGQWAAATFIAACDEHLQWWLEIGDGVQDAWQFEVHFCHGAQLSYRQSRRGRGRNFHTDCFRVVAVGDFVNKKIR